MSGVDDEPQRSGHDALERGDSCFLGEIGGVRLLGTGPPAQVGCNPQAWLRTCPGRM